MASDSLDVVVAGGGIGGAAAALLLARAGHHVTVLERIASPQAVGAGILLQANGLAVLHGLGLRDALEARGAPVDAVRLLQTDGTPIADQPVPDLGERLDHLLVLRRSHLAQVLADAMAAEPAVDVVWGAEVTGTGDPSSWRAGDVRYRTAEGSHELEAELVVGADGIHSVVRDGGGFGATVSATGSTYLRAIVPPTENLGGEVWTPLGLFGSADLVDGTYFYADVTSPSVRAAVEAHDLDAIRAAWTEVLPASTPLLEAVATFDDLLVNDVRRVDCPCWVQGRTALLGDAAHAMEPTLGQGANSALVDAAVLAVELASGSRVHALIAYDRRRRPAVAKVQRDADRLARASRLRSPVVRRLRDAAIRRAARPRSSDKRYRALQQEDPVRLLADVRALGPGRP